MDIKNVELLTTGTKELGYSSVFLVTDKTGLVYNVPTEGDSIHTNVHYREFRNWYERRKNTPFDFKFEKDPEANEAAEEVAAPIPTQKATEPKPDLSASGVNLTRAQVKEIEKEQAEGVKRGTAGLANLGS